MPRNTHSNTPRISQKQLERKISYISDNICFYLVKTLAFNQRDSTKNLLEIDKILHALQYESINNKRVLKAKNWLHPLWTKSESSEASINNYFLILHNVEEKYGRKRTPKQVFNILRNIWPNISLDLSKNKFKSVRQYLSAHRQRTPKETQRCNTPAQYDDLILSYFNDIHF